MNANRNINGLAQRFENSIRSIWHSRKNKISVSESSRNDYAYAQWYRARMFEDSVLLGTCVFTLFALYYTYNFVNGIWMP